MVIDFVFVILQHFIGRIDIDELQNIKSCTQTTFGLLKGRRPEFNFLENWTFWTKSRVFQSSACFDEILS